MFLFFQRSQFTKAGKNFVKAACRGDIGTIFKYPRVFTLVDKQMVWDKSRFVASMHGEEAWEEYAEALPYKPVYYLDFLVNKEKWNTTITDSATASKFREDIFPFFLKEDDEDPEGTIPNMLQNWGPDTVRFFFYEGIGKYTISDWENMSHPVGALRWKRTVSKRKVEELTGMYISSIEMPKRTIPTPTKSEKIREHEEQLLLHTAYALYAKNPNYISVEDMSIEEKEKQRKEMKKNIWDSRYPDAKYPYMYIQLTPNRGEREGTGYRQWENSIPSWRSPHHRSSTEEYLKEVEENLADSTMNIIDKETPTQTSKKQNVWNFKAYLSSDEVQEFSDVFMKRIGKGSYNTENVWYGKRSPYMFDWTEYDNRQQKQYGKKGNHKGEPDEKEGGDDEEMIPYIPFIIQLLENNMDNTQKGGGGSLDIYTDENPKKERKGDREP